MKKVILTSVTAVAALSSLNVQAAANSTAICAAPSQASNSSATVATTGFVKVAFTPKCSTNVYMTGDDQTTYYGVGSASLKGKNVFQGSTAGGGVKASAACGAPTGCTSTEAQDAATSAPSN